MESFSDTLNFLSAISFPKCQSFQIFSRQQTHSCVGTSSFTDTACPWFSTVINVLLLLPKSTTSKPPQKSESLIISSHSWAVALSGFEAMYALSSVIGLFVTREHFLLFKQTSQCCRSGAGGREHSGLSYLWANKLECWLITGLECEKSLVLNWVCC